MTPIGKFPYHWSMAMKRPNMTSYFRARIDHHVNGMLARTTARLPQGVKGVKGDVTDRVIIVTMTDGTRFFWEGGKRSSKKVNLTYAPLMPKPVTVPSNKYEDGHTYHGPDCMSPWGEARRYTLPLTPETIEMNHRLHVQDVLDEPVNLWGRPKEDVGEGFCRECERDYPGHYDSCILYPHNR